MTTKKDKNLSANKKNGVRTYRIALHQNLMFEVVRDIKASTPEEAEDKMYKMLNDGELDADWNHPISNQEYTTVDLKR